MKEDNIYAYNIIKMKTSFKYAFSIKSEISNTMQTFFFFVKMWQSYFMIIYNDMNKCFLSYVFIDNYVSLYNT